MHHELTSKLKKIKCFISDVDGVLSNGLLYLTNQGDEIKSFHVHDGLGLKFLMAANIQVAIITASKNNIIDKRMQQLGIQHYFCGRQNKVKAYQELKQHLKLSDDECAYIGDDLPDLPLLEQVGFSATVSDGRPEVKDKVDFISKHPGGYGAVREVVDLILYAQQKMHIALESFLENADK